MGVFKIGKMIMRSLFSKPATLMYPVIPRVYGEKTRGHIEVDMDACVLCGICSKKCPTNAIEVNRKAKEWSISRLQCIQCNCCVEYCPKNCLYMKNSYSPSTTVKERDVFKKAEAAKPAAPKAEAIPAAEAAAEAPLA